MKLSPTPIIDVDYNLQESYGATLTVAGLPVGVYNDANGYYAAATFQNVFVAGSPLVVYFDPPVATVAEISLPALLGYLVETIANGGVISL